MPYPEDYQAAGRRLFHDGNHLYERARYGTAAHIFGLAAECGIKSCMGDIPGGDRELPRKHLPDLIADAKRWLKGKRKSGMAQLLKKHDYMHGWYIDNRYWPDEAFAEQDCRRYRDDARRTLSAGGVFI